MVMIGAVVRSLRERAGLSQAELAEKAMLTQKTVSAIETGETNGLPRTRRKLAEALGVGPEALWPPEQQAN